VFRRGAAPLAAMSADPEATTQRALEAGWAGESDGLRREHTAAGVFGKAAEQPAQRRRELRPREFDLGTLAVSDPALCAHLWPGPEVERVVRAAVDPAHLRVRARGGAGDEVGGNGWGLGRVGSLGRMGSMGRPREVVLARQVSSLTGRHGIDEEVREALAVTVESARGVPARSLLAGAPPLLSAHCQARPAPRAVCRARRPRAPLSCGRGAGR
jgi:hypothetical protein